MSEPKYNCNIAERNEIHSDSDKYSQHAIFSTLVQFLVDTKSQSHGSNIMHLSILKTTCSSSKYISKCGIQGIYMISNMQDCQTDVCESQLSLRSTENDVKKRKYPVTVMYMNENALLMSVISGEQQDCFWRIGR